MLTDVFFCTAANPEDYIRWHIALACKHRWLQEPEIELHIITPEIVGCDRRAFQGARRTYADDNAKSDIYIMCDDDCLPLGINFSDRGVILLRNNPEYAVMATRFWCDKLPESNHQDDIVTINTAGGINFTRKGIIDFPRNGEMWDDSHQSADVREKGLKTGCAKNLWMNHFGYKLGTVFPDDYKSGITQIANF